MCAAVFGSIVAGLGRAGSGSDGVSVENETAVVTRKSRNGRFFVGWRADWI